MKMPRPRMHWTELGPAEVIYSWDDPETGKHYHWAVERLERDLIAAARVEVIKINIDKKFAESMYELRGLEDHRLERIPEDSSIWTPIIVCRMPDGTGLIVEGNHRYYKASQMGEEFIRAWYITEDIWKWYLVELPKYDMPSNSGFSGIR